MEHVPNIKTMENLDLDFLALQETYINTNSIETKPGYTFLFSTSVDNKVREEAAKKKQKLKKLKRQLLLANTLHLQVLLRIILVS